MVETIDLEPDSCYRSILARDPRFDGQFFIGVITTRIYCRPICPAKTPKQENCTFFLSAAAAQQAGFRPCLRCRPELSPHLFAYVGTGAIVTRALRAIEAGALDEGSVKDLAAQLGVGDRHLRQLFARYLGTSPLAVAQTRRLLFAKQLLDETSLSITDVAMAAGFASIRRFNDVIDRVYGRSPSDLRRTVAGTPTLSFRLPFSPPLNWPELIDADLTGLGITKARRAAISALAAAVVANPQLLAQWQGLEDTVRKLCALPGIGEWTAQSIAMRAFGEPDAFPSSDLALLRSMEKLGETVTKGNFEARSQGWRPWRAYAAMHLWTWDGK